MDIISITQVWPESLLADGLLSPRRSRRPKQLTETITIIFRSGDSISHGGSVNLSPS